MNRLQPLVAALGLLAALPLPARAQHPEERPAVLGQLEKEDEPVRSFLPKYTWELFALAGYTGTWASSTRQYPTLFAGAELLFARPRRWDFGVFTDLRLGRPDESLRRWELAAGPTVMFRFDPSAFTGWAAVARAAYLLDFERSDTFLLRPSLGAQFDVVRWLALMATADMLYTPDRFADGDHVAWGFSVTLKVGICPMTNMCPQAKPPKRHVLDRSPVTCRVAGDVCRAAKSEQGRENTQFCQAVLRAMNASTYPARWGDSVRSLLYGIREQAPKDVLDRVGADFAELEETHAASMNALHDYPTKLGQLPADKRYKQVYSYLVTPSNIRDWLGCGADGGELKCLSEEDCNRETGIEEK